MVLTIKNFCSTNSSQGSRRFKTLHYVMIMECAKWYDTKIDLPVITFATLLLQFSYLSLVICIVKYVLRCSMNQKREATTMHQFQCKFTSFCTTSFLVVFKWNHSFFTQKLDVLTKTKASCKIKRTLSLLFFKTCSNKKTFQVFQLNETIQIQTAS